MKKIALISDGWKRLVTYSWMDGIMERARELDLDLCLYQYNTNGNWSYDKKHNLGEYSLFQLPDYSQYDGIIFDCTNMTDAEQIDKIVAKLKELDIPVVSISYAVDGFYYVGNDNRKLFRIVLDHLYEKHNCRSFVFAGGPEYNYENQMRFQAFKEAMRDYNIPLTDEMCLFGDFDFDTGVHYMEEWLASGRPLPESFVCANDNIAAGICSAAAQHGLKIPQDFMVTGFDNLDKAAYYNPQITTVEHNRGNIGKSALQILVDLWDGKEVDVFHYLYSECIPGESCGCPNSGKVQYRNYIKWQIEYSVKKDRDDEAIMVLENHIKECDNFIDLFQNFSEYIENLRCDGIYIVVDKELLEAQLESEFPKQEYHRERMVVGYASEHHKRLDNMVTIEDLAKHLERNGKGNAYLFTATHFRDQIVGFTALKNPVFLYDNPYYYDVHTTFVTTLESLYKQIKLENAYEKVKEVYNRDSLTGLYNRVAYTEMIVPRFRRYCADNIACAMVFFDADYFKQINDICGHKFGDEVLKTIAKVLEENKPEDGYAYRFGGDEFVVFFPNVTTEKIERFVKAVTNLLASKKIQVSHGVIVTDPKSGRSLDEYLVMADKKMYEVKSARKKEGKLKQVLYKGVDISSLPEHLDGGEHFYTADGREVDAFTLLKENQIGSVRLRIWNDPSSVPEAKGYCDLKHTVEMAKKIKENHMHFFLDFHYSDYWADPGQQHKPHAWEGLSFDELVQAVYDFTSQVLNELDKAGCMPDMVQVGNEIRSGMLFPDGEVPNYDRLAKLVNAGIRAVRDSSGNITVMIHLDQGGRFYYMKEWFDAMFAAGMEPIDAIGISFYSFWHGTFMDLRACMTQLIQRYKVPVYVVETAHPWRHCETEHVSEDLMKTAGLPGGIEQQKKSLQLVMQIASEVSGNLPTGVYYWEPLCIPSHGYGSWDENMGMLDERGQALCSFEAYRDFDPENPPIPDLDDYIESLYAVDESDLLPAGTNLVPNGDFSQGAKGWWVLNEPKNVTVEERENELYVSAKCNFTCQIFREIYIDQPGSYTLSVEYRGTNTTGVKIALFLKEISCNGEKEYSKDIFPSDVRFVTHSLEAVELEAGQVQLGIRLETPPVFGRIKNIRLVRME